MASNKHYAAERLQLMQRRMVIAAALAVVLVPIFGYVDYFLDQPHFVALMSTRVLSSLVALIILMLVRRPGAARHAPWLAVLLILQCAVAITGIPVYLTGTLNPHYVSAALLILASTAVLPWTVVQAAVLTLSVTAMVVAAAYSGHALVDVAASATQMSAIVVTGVIGLIVSALSEAVRQREFAARSDLQEASRDKTRLIQHLEKLTARLETANEDMGERQRETDDFLYVLSHDLRAPLINIQGFGKRLHTDMVSLTEQLTSDDAVKRIARMQQSLDFVNAGTAKIDQLISRLLEVARLTTRPARHTWIDTSAMTRDVIAACRFQLDSARAEVSVGDLPRVWGDPVQLNQVFTNLIDNAVKYMNGRSPKRIAITHTSQGDRFRFAVHDTGPGIEAKDQEKIFRLFARLAPNGAAAGDGVGLATVRAIINRHGGRIWVESTLGAGSTFYFTLPQQPPQTQETGAAAPPQGLPLPGPTQEEAVTYAH